MKNAQGGDLVLEECGWGTEGQKKRNKLGGETLKLASGKKVKKGVHLKGKSRCNHVY